MPTTDREPGFARRAWRSPALRILLLAPVFGEGLSGSSPPLVLLLPWNLAFMIALYGCGALVCREVAHRFGLGFPGLVLLGTAYGVWEEALVDRYWFFPTFWEDSGVGTYSVVHHTNILLATHLTAFHTAISIGAAVLVVEWATPEARHRPWVGRPGLTLASIILASTPLIYGELDQRPPTPVLLGAAVLLIAIVAAAFAVGRRTRPGSSPAPARTGAPRRGIALVVFACVLGHWIVTYSVPATDLPWPVGVLLALLPVGIAMAVVPVLSRTGPYGSDGIRVVVGLLSFFALLDLLVAFLGQYDMVLVALGAAWLARHLHRRRDVLGYEVEEYRGSRA